MRYMQVIYGFCVCHFTLQKSSYLQQIAEMHMFLYISIPFIQTIKITLNDLYIVELDQLNIKKLQFKNSKTMWCNAGHHVVHTVPGLMTFSEVFFAVKFYVASLEVMQNNLAQVRMFFGTRGSFSVRQDSVTIIACIRIKIRQPFCTQIGVSLVLSTLACLSWCQYVLLSMEAHKQLSLIITIVTSVFYCYIQLVLNIMNQRCSSTYYSLFRQSSSWSVYSLLFISWFLQS